MDYQVRLSRSARADIQVVVRYISIDDSSHAVRFGRLLIQHINSLGRLPERGRVVPEFENKSLREIIFRAYRIVYRLNHDKRVVEVVRVLHTARSIPDLTLLN